MGTGLLDNRVAVITGAAHPQGIGRAIANAFEQAGATVVVTDLASAEGLNEANGLACDVTDRQQIDDVVDTIMAEHGQIDILVNNAGIGAGSGDFLELSQRDFDLNVDINLGGVFHMCQAVVPHMLERQNGSIINVASLAGLGALDSIPALYTASKFAVVGLTKQIAAQYASNGIRCNALCPGSVATQMYEQTMNLISEQHGISYEEAEALELASIPMGRPAQPSDVAEAALFLASDLSSYLTGVSLPVAGGMAPGL